MANSPPSSVKSEPTGTFYSAQDQNLSYTSMYDTSIENTLLVQTGEIPPISSSIYIDAPVRPSNDTSFDLLQGYSAPTLPVYINMGLDRQRDDVTFAGPTATTTDSQYSRSLVAMDVDYLQQQIKDIFIIIIIFLIIHKIEIVIHIYKDQ